MRPTIDDSLRTIKEGISDLIAATIIEAERQGERHYHADAWVAASCNIPGCAGVDPIREGKKVFMRGIGSLDALGLDHKFRQRYAVDTKADSAV